MNDYDFLMDEDFIRWRLFQTKELDEYWEDFLAKNPLLEKAFDEAIVQFNAVRINQMQLPEEDKKEIHGTILARIRHYKQRRLWRIAGAAAAVLLIGVMAVLFFPKGDQNAVALQKSETIVGQMLPNEDIYLVSDGKKINIADQSHIGLTKDGRTLVIDSADSQRRLALAKGMLNKLVVPYGKRTRLTLSDGTQVWLNSGTELDFPAEFAGGTREIHVNGEIFIDVAHNPKIPFIVHAQGMDVRVHGTSFNVTAYHDDSKKSVVLVHGKVNIETSGMGKIALSPNEKAEITDNSIRKEVVNVSEYTSWTKGVLEFNETPVSEIFRKIGRYYNVQFGNSPDMKLNNKTCSGKLFLSNNLDSVMTSVSVLSSTIYRRENNIIHITKK